MLAGMLSPLNDRGPIGWLCGLWCRNAGACEIHPSSTGFDLDLERLLKGLRDGLGSPVGHRLHGTHVVLSVPAERAALARRALAAFEEVAIVGAGRRMEIFKEVGRPDDVSRQFGLGTMNSTPSDIPGWRLNRP